jgi:hypothetical protein
MNHRAASTGRRCRCVIGGSTPSRKLMLKIAQIRAIRSGLARAKTSAKSTSFAAMDAAGPLEPFIAKAIRAKERSYPVKA